MTTISPSKWIKGSEVVLGESADVLASYYERQAHLVFTSPPYYNQRKEYAEYSSFKDYILQMEAIWAECYRILKDGGIIGINIGNDRKYDLPSWISCSLARVGFKYVDTIVWDKIGEIGERGVHINNNLYYPNFRWEPIFIYRKPTKGEKLQLTGANPDFPQFEERFKSTILTNLRTNVWQVIPEKNSLHPAAFPVRLPYYAIMCYTPKGGVVVDPFGGSGTTAIAAEQIGDRTYLLVERASEYHKMILKRISENQQQGLNL